MHTSFKWPEEEAKSLLKALKGKIPKKGYVLFVTGYAPSGLPHIGTFNEVARTLLVKRCFERLSNMPTRLLCISDDYDGLRKVPLNIPNRETIGKYLALPLSAIPDPFHQEKSYAEYMNKKMKKFLDNFGIECELVSATERYKSGYFDETLEIVFDLYEEIMNIMLPTLREERKQTYSPFMPICKKTGKVLQVPTLELNKLKKTIVYKDEEGELQETKVTGGKCKLQWKPDFAMRWTRMQTDYEMYGKDHGINIKIYHKLCRALGGIPPQYMIYEMFLDEQGRKISKSVGEGVSLNDWLKYGTVEAMKLYIYRTPKKAKRLYFEMIQRTIDEYIILNKEYHQNKQSDHIMEYIHIDGEIPQIDMHDITFSLLLNLVSISDSTDVDIIIKFLQRYLNISIKDNAFLMKMINLSIIHYKDRIKNHKQYIIPTGVQIDILKDLKEVILNSNSDNLESQIYNIGKKHYGKEKLKNYFSEIYQILLGQSSGPRLSTLIQMYGNDNFIKLLDNKLLSKLN